MKPTSALALRNRLIGRGNGLEGFGANASPMEIAAWRRLRGHHRRPGDLFKPLDKVYQKYGVSVRSGQLVKVARTKSRVVPLGKEVTRQDYITAIERLKPIHSTQPDFHSSTNLPLSPLENAEQIAARSRWDAEKPQYKPSDDSFRAKVAHSAAAHMLATPVRMCALSSARLPAAFLVPFTLRKHPQTNKPWHVPLFENSRDLATCYYAGVRAASEAAAQMRYKDYMRTIPSRWKQQLGSSQLKEIVVRPDLADFVARGLRIKVREEMGRAVERGYVVEGEGVEGEEELVLWLGEGNVPLDLTERGAVDMPRIFGEEESLKPDTGAETMVVKIDKSTVKLRMWLTRLKLYNSL